MKAREFFLKCILFLKKGCIFILHQLVIRNLGVHQDVVVHMYNMDNLQLRGDRQESQPLKGSLGHRAS